MFVVREVLHCRPGKVKELTGRFQALAPIMTRKGYEPFRLMTDVSGERYGTVAAEFEVESLGIYTLKR